MRAIGECEVLISLMVMRSQERSTFGKRIDDYSSTQAAISLSRIELDQCRLLVQQAAHLLDTVGNKTAQQADFYDQSGGGEQLSEHRRSRDSAVWRSWGYQRYPRVARLAKARAFRIYDGPDEVHLQTIARLEAAEQDLSTAAHYLSGI